jgi:hypothetical protein
MAWAKDFLIPMGAMREDNWKMGRDDIIDLTRTKHPTGF